MNRNNQWLWRFLLICWRRMEIDKIEQTWFFGQDFIPICFIIIIIMLPPINEWTPFYRVWKWLAFMQSNWPNENIDGSINDPTSKLRPWKYGTYGFLLHRLQASKLRISRWPESFVKIKSTGNYAIAALGIENILWIWSFIDALNTR